VATIVNRVQTLASQLAEIGQGTDERSSKFDPNSKHKELTCREESGIEAFWYLSNKNGRVPLWRLVDFGGWYRSKVVADSERINPNDTSRMSLLISNSLRECTIPQSVSELESYRDLDGVSEWGWPQRG